jgi:XTP/dITP diphosphohydrolase
METPKTPIRILIASGNNHKIEEIGGYFQRAGIEVECLPATHLEGLEENGTTFSENALIKAKYVIEEARNRGCTHTLGDDSGFIVQALSGEDNLREFPGVHSNRWLTPARQIALLGAEVKEGVTHTHRCQALLQLLGDSLNRGGSFVCAMALINLQEVGVPQVLEGRCPVWVRPDKQLVGTGGFGYDPIVHPLGVDGLPKPRTMAELSAEEKAAISHRGIALQQVVGVLTRWRTMASK